MMKALRYFGLALLAAASTVTATASVSTLTNVLQNISVQLTIYEQGPTNAAGTKVTAKPVSFSTKNLIAALQAVTGQSFGANPKLVLNNVFSNVIITNFASNNIATLLTNSWPLTIGGTPYNFAGTNVVTISNNTFITVGAGAVSTNVVVYYYNTNESVTFFTNTGFVTTFTPQTNGGGVVTNVVVVSRKPGTTALTESLFTNVSSSAAILYGKTNALYPVGSYIIFSTNSPLIVTETGTGLGTNSPIAPSLSSQMGYSVSNLAINYFAPFGTTNLALTLEGFVKQALKVDILERKGTNLVVENIFGANATWNVIGSGYVGGTFSTNVPSGIAVSNLVDGVPLSGYLTNTSPVVVQGTINISFLKNLAQ
jgi:hypothetical protein